jgi:hypothetical protein
MVEDDWDGKYTKMESQFMRATGTLVSQTGYHCLMLLELTTRPKEVTTSVRRRASGSPSLCQTPSSCCAGTCSRM